jgi:hypothetical protein
VVNDRGKPLAIIAVIPHKIAISRALRRSAAPLQGILRVQRYYVYERSG